MGQPDNLLENQPAGSHNPHLHTNLKFLNDIAGHLGEPLPTPKTERPKSETAQIKQAGQDQPADAKPAAPAIEPVKERPAYKYRDKNVEAEVVRKGLFMPSLWHGDDKTTDGKNVGHNKDFKVEAMEDAPINLDNFREVQAQWYENKPTRVER